MSVNTNNVPQKFNLQAKLMSAVAAAELKQKSEAATVTSSNTKPKKTVEDFPNLKHFMSEENCKTLEEALFRAINFSRVDIIRELVQCGVNANATITSGDYHGATPLFMTLLRAYRAPDLALPGQHSIQRSRETCIEVMNILVEARADINEQPTVWFPNGGAGMAEDEQFSYLHYIVSYEVSNANTSNEDPKLNILKAFLQHKPRLNEIVPGINMNEIVPPFSRQTVFSNVLRQLYSTAYHHPNDEETPGILHVLKGVINLLIESGIQDYEERITIRGGDLDVGAREVRATNIFPFAMMLKSYLNEFIHEHIVSDIADTLIEDMVFQTLTGVYPAFKRLSEETRGTFESYCLSIFSPSSIGNSQEEPQARLDIRKNIAVVAWQWGIFGSAVGEGLASTGHPVFAMAGGPAEMVLAYSAPCPAKPRPSAHPALIFSILKEEFQQAWPKENSAKSEQNTAMVATTSTAVAKK